MNGRERRVLKRLEWIASLRPDSCPGGVPTDEGGWRDLINRIVREVRGVVREVSELDGADSGLLPAHGGYRHLKSFQTATLIYDGTVIFCDRFISMRSRTHDQMVQAARSGRQNIAEGSVASATSKKTEIKLTNVAKASLEELLLDYEDVLRQRGMRQWGKDDPEALAVRRRKVAVPLDGELSEGSDASDRSDESRPLLDPYGLGEASLEVAANTLICLIHQCTWLLRRQLKGLEKEFLEEGGFTEALYRKRRERRDGSPR